MNKMSITMEFLKDTSNMLVRSPSCTCVLKDLLKMIIDHWKAPIGILAIKNNNGKLLPLAQINSGIEMDLFEDMASLDCVIKALRGYSGVTLIEQSITKNLYAVALPFWLENKIHGIFFMAVYMEKPIDDDELNLLQVLINQIALSLEMELAKEKINTLNDCFNSVLDSLTEGIIIIGGTQIIYSNAAVNNLLGIKESIVFKDLEDFINQIIKLSKDQIKTQIYLETSKVIKNNIYSFELETKESRSLKVTKFQIRGNTQEILSYGFLIIDITKHKGIEKFKNDLIGIVGHELRTPLTCIKGNVSSLLRKGVVWEDDIRHTFLQDIYDECDRLNIMIEKLLDVSKINAGVLKLEKGLVTIDKLMQKVVVRAKTSYRQQINLKHVIANGEEIIEIDEQRLLQVFMNLIDNAVKYGHRNTEEVSEIFISAAKQNDRVIFFIRDKGPGISKEELKKVFSKFYQLNSKGTEQIGSGLGLAICKGIIEAHNGSIWAESIVGKGTTFFFTIHVNKQRLVY